MPVPPLSVVMPVRDALPHLHEAVASILGQTFGDFELVIHDDASTDGSREALREWAARDGRIRLFESETALGVVAGSNELVRLARAPLIARMDADDIAHRDRLRRQVEVLRSHPGVVLVGTLWETIDGDGRVVRRRDRWRLARGSAFAPFHHASIVFRRDAFERTGGYREACRYWEDVDLFLRMAGQGRVAVLPDALLRVRHSPSSVRLRARDDVEEAHDRMFRSLGARGAAGGLLPQAIVSPAMVELWAGGRPRILGRLGRRARLLPPGRDAAVAVIWAAWAAAGPSSLRRALRLLHRLRELSARRRIGDGAVYEWIPGRPPREIA